MNTDIDASLQQTTAAPNSPSEAAPPPPPPGAPDLLPPAPDQAATGGQELQAIPPVPEAPPQPPPVRKRPLPIVVDPALGKVELLSPEDEVEFQRCEAVVREGGAHFVRVGQALTRIKAKALYRNEYRGFEQYCRERWGFGHSKVWGYMAAAKVHQTLAAIPGVPLPDCEAQIRPLARLPEELAPQVWLQALSLSPDGQVTARQVQRALRQVLKTERPAAAATSAVDRKQRQRLRQSVRAGFGDLLALLMTNAERDVLIAKVQEIERLLGPILSPKKTKV